MAPGQTPFSRGGRDTVSYVDAAVAVTASLVDASINSGDAAGDDYNDFVENLRGSTHGDVLVGNSGANRLDGDPGDDTLIGGGGTDTLIGGAGRDRYVFGIAGVTAGTLVTDGDASVRDILVVDDYSWALLGNATISGVEDLRIGFEFDGGSHRRADGGRRHHPRLGP